MRSCKTALLRRGKGRIATDNNILIDTLGALILLVMLLAWRKPAGGIRLRDKLIFALILCCLAILVSDIPGILLDGSSFSGARGLLWLFDTLYWLLHPLYGWLWLMFSSLWCSGSEEKALRRAWLYAIPLLLEALIVLSNPFTGVLFVLSGENLYSPGSAYQLSLIPCYIYAAAAPLTALCAFFKDADADHRRHCLSLLAYTLLPVYGVAMEVFAYGVSWVWPMAALSLLMVYFHMQQQLISEERIVAAQTAAAAAQVQAEAANSRMAIMLSQIQPHFLYNALCVIQDLCHNKAPEAEQATIAFSRFLRGNLDSLKATKPIPFTQELGHTRYYLTLEQMRFGQRLRVEYALKTEQFRLPAMTLQPIVENAVRYGIMKREDGGTLVISSAEREDAYIVTVEDDGVGFDPEQTHEDGRSHIGIENVRQRLHEMCGGELVIVSAADKGTRAEIILPKETVK